MTVHKQIITNRVAFLEKKVPLYASALGLIGLLVLWEIICSTKIVSPLFLPAPSAILVTGWDMLISGEITRNLGPSLYRIGLGYRLDRLLVFWLGLF